MSIKFWPGMKVSLELRASRWPATVTFQLLWKGSNVLCFTTFICRMCWNLVLCSCFLPARYKETVGFLVVPTKMIVGFPFIYHYAAGMRHLVCIPLPIIKNLSLWQCFFQYWDKTAEGLTNEQAEMTSRALIAGTGLLTLAAAFTTI